MFMSRAIYVWLAIAVTSACSDKGEVASQQPSGYATSARSVIGKPRILTVPRPSVNQYEAAISRQDELLRLSLAIQGERIDFYEWPKDIDDIRSQVTLRCKGTPRQHFDVGRLVGHRSLSLVHVATIPQSNHSYIVVAEYEGGAVGARIGFAIMRVSHDQCALRALPLTAYGKVVVSMRRPDEFVLWSALGGEVGPSIARRRYGTRTCTWRRDSLSCGREAVQEGMFYPTAMNDPGIAIEN